MRIENITTKIRPILKLFIIEPNDFESFERIIKDISSDVDMIFNIFLENNDEIFSSLHKEFVKRQNPDIIFNLSNKENSLIESFFNVMCISPENDMTRITRYVSNLEFISNTPSLIKKYSQETASNDVFCANDFNTKNILSMINSLNFGLYIKEDTDLKSSSVFKDIKVKYIKAIADIKGIAFDKEKSFNRLYNQVSPFSSGYGSSVYDIDYSNSQDFRKGKYIFISPSNRLSGMLYFWNMRAINPHSSFFWLPKESISDYKYLFTDDVIIIASDDIQNILIKNNINNTRIDNDRLYFNGSASRWTLFEHSQTINIPNEDSIHISHPIEKSFSEFGLGGACIFEVSGIKEFLYPNNSKIGKLFELKNFDSEFFSERFLNLHNNKLSKYYLDINPFEGRDLSINIRIPDFKEVITNIFHNDNFILQATDKTSIFNQLIKAMGSVDYIHILFKENIFEIFKNMTPKKGKNRIDKMAEFINDGSIELTPVILTLNKILSGIEDKTEVKNTLQELSKNKLLLRGKHFKCNHCSSKIWISLEDISRVNYCYACNTEVNIHIEEDNYRLNQLLINAYDQGQLATLTLLNFFVESNVYNLRYMSNQEVIKNGETTAFTDLDLIVNIGNRIGFAECKSNSAFNEKQIADLIDMSKKMKADFIILSTLLDKDNKELEENIEYLKTQTLDVPLFIFTKEVLFNPKSVKLNKYFEVFNNEFKKGVFLLANN